MHVLRCPRGTELGRIVALELIVVAQEERTLAAA